MRSGWQSMPAPFGRAVAAGVVCGFAVLLSGVNVLAQGPSQGDDKYIWLENVSSPKSMDWVNAENARSMKVFEADPHFKEFEEEAVKLGSNPNRLPMPALRGDEVYNSWRDKDHARGLLRKTSVADYLTADPHWKTVIDFDALGKTEHVGWVPKGRSCLYPGDQYCLIAISAGGEDAVTEREFNLKTGQWVPDGFTLSHSKQNVSWIDKDTLLVDRDWGAGTMTNSGYAFVVKKWKRGTPLESATEVFRGAATDEVGSSGRVLHDAQGHSLTMFHRGVTFFESQEFIQTPRGIERLAIPGKAGLHGMIDGRLIVEIRENWTPAGGNEHFKEGSLLELKLADVLKDPAHLKPSVVFVPTDKEFLAQAAVGKSRILVTTLANVQGRAYVYSPAGAGWTKTKLALPDNVAVSITSMNDTDDRFFVSVTGFLTPPSVWIGDAATGSLKQAKAEPAQFDASNLTVDQLSAKSKDGTVVPYFVVHQKGMKYDGSNATLLTAYGGFEIAETPTYSAVRGKLWLDRGGVFVLANIRGGGEFGPAWHEAGLKTHRQRIYDDFAAVGQDLITRKITSTPHLGIQGGSNGGLLMGVEMTQHPNLWSAIVIDVPLLDMLRFEHIAAGASWVGEYGSVNVPQEQAFLAGISPYNQLKPDVKYPVPFIFTTTKDDRVGPQHARKFAAKMAEYHEPFYFYELTEGGHGSGASIQQEAQTNAMTYVYLTEKLMQ
ncbi:MAG TPA: prolyl oligopeptidase family serine peptidase [Acidobacteriaceae bacterium]